ncbi:hypothetical protein [Neisseria dentiae]|uniref:hypothetical protein n=1 Tax=Neisseria dentiae TaxID=194197 RepID=UPI0035A07E8B
MPRADFLKLIGYIHRAGWSGGNRFLTPQTGISDQKTAFALCQQALGDGLNFAKASGRLKTFSDGLIVWRASNVLQRFISV